MNRQIDSPVSSWRKPGPDGGEKKRKREGETEGWPPENRGGTMGIRNIQEEWKQREIGTLNIAALNRGQVVIRSTNDYKIP